jgi:hypothetical protein
MDLLNQGGYGLGCFTYRCLLMKKEVGSIKDSSKSEKQLVNKIQPFYSTDVVFHYL